jgi:hypothetical protein
MWGGPSAADAAPFSQNIQPRDPNGNKVFQEQWKRPNIHENAVPLRGKHNTSIWLFSICVLQPKI